MTDAACWLDRRLPSEFARELEPGGGLRWLVDFALSSAGSPLTDLVLVGESKPGRRSKVHLYGGTAGLLTVVRHGNGQVKRVARTTTTFRSLTFPDAWAEQRTVHELGAIVPALLDHLTEKAAIATHGNYGKEGAVQVAVMRAATSS